MIIRSLLNPFKQRSGSYVFTYQCVRSLHHSIPLRPTPSPTPFIPDVQTFLTVIGRDLSSYSAKIPTWEALFTLSSQQLRDLGVEPARSRRYLLHWREKFRNGEFGVGGDLKDVTNGVADIRVVEVPVALEHASGWSKAATASSTPNTIKRVVNVPMGSDKPSGPLEDAMPVKFMHVRGAHTLTGPHVETLPGTSGMGGRIKVKEGLWEVKRGRKIDGGERRRDEVRAKRLSALNKERREKEGI